MRQYFESMDALGKPLAPAELAEMAANREQVAAVLKELDAEVSRVKNAGLPAAKIHERGEMTVWDRIEYLVEPGTFRPVHTLYNPRQNEEGTTGVVDGLARIGGKLYRQGLIKMNEFVTLCGRDRVPIIWFQDTTGIDVGDTAEKAELLGLGQSLIYSIEQTDLPMMLAVLRKGTAAAHYIMGGPTANNHNAFTLGTPATEIYVMHGETAAVASFSRRLVKEQEAGRPVTPVIDQMNALARLYHEQSRPAYCAKRGFVDEVVAFDELRRYLVAFAGSVYQNPPSICPQHHMLLPRLIRSQIVKGLERPKKAR